MKVERSMSMAPGDFSGERLKLARRLKAVTKASLAAEVGVSATALAQYERGDSRPSAPVLERLATALGVAPNFLGASMDVPSVPASAAHFRSLRSTSVTAREQALAFGELAGGVRLAIEGYVELDRSAGGGPTLLELREELEQSAISDPVAAARFVRRRWALGARPIKSMLTLLEDHGALVVRLPDVVNDKVSAFSAWQGEQALVLLVQAREDRARSRFDAAHELGHLLLHQAVKPGSKQLEAEANDFASELLMPAEAIKPQLPHRIDWPAFKALKREWGVSLRALVYRAHKLGCLTDISYRRANQQLAIMGLPEPVDLGLAEAPALLSRAKAAMVDAGLDFYAIMSRSGLPADLVDQVIAASGGGRIRLR